MVLLGKRHVTYRQDPQTAGRQKGTICRRLRISGCRNIMGLGGLWGSDSQSLWGGVIHTMESSHCRQIQIHFFIYKLFNSWYHYPKQALPNHHYPNIPQAFWSLSWQNSASRPAKSYKTLVLHPELDSMYRPQSERVACLSMKNSFSFKG